MPESLKNILLVMANGGLLVPPSQNPEHTLLWEETWKRLNRFLPEMFVEIFPEPRKEEVASAQVSATAPAEEAVETKAK